jgi:hypothetical protein
VGGFELDGDRGKDDNDNGPVSEPIVALRLIQYQVRMLERQMTIVMDALRKMPDENEMKVLFAEQFEQRSIPTKDEVKRIVSEELTENNRTVVEGSRWNWERALQIGTLIVALIGGFLGIGTYLKASALQIQPQQMQQYVPQYNPPLPQDHPRAK